MITKKPTEKQLAARKRFAAMAKSGELAKKRKTGLKKPVTKGLTTLCAKTVGVTGRRKKDGTVKKKHVVSKGGKVVAVKKKTGLKGVSKTKALNIQKTHTIEQYKNGVHQMHDTIKVKSKSGKLFHIGKSESLDMGSKKGYKEVYYLGKKALFELNGTDYRRSKVSVVNFLKAN